MPRLTHLDPRDDAPLGRPAAEEASEYGVDDLVRAARRGESWALDQLYRRFNSSLVRYLHVHASGDEHDLASDVWLDVAAGLARFEGDAEGFRRWIFTIARRRAIDSARKRTRRRTDSVPAEQFIDRAGPGDVEQTALEAAEGMVAARRIVALLPQDQAEVVLLRVVGQLTVGEVAEIVGRPRSWVSVTQHRALRRLAEQLGP